MLHPRFRSLKFCLLCATCECNFLQVTSPLNAILEEACPGCYVEFTNVLTEMVAMAFATAPQQLLGLAGQKSER